MRIILAVTILAAMSSLAARAERDRDDRHHPPMTTAPHPRQPDGQPDSETSPPRVQGEAGCASAMTRRMQGRWRSGASNERGGRGAAPS